MAVISNTLIAGFTDPVQHAQQIFRDVLKAMSEPGTITRNALCDSTPDGLNRACWQLALSLLDADTRIWLSPRLAANEAVVSNLRFHCQSPLVEEPGDAEFALCDADEIPAMSELYWGCAEYPDRSTTLIIQVPAISDEPFWTLTGPGIEQQRSLRIAGLPEAFRQTLIESRQRFPMGIDTLFCSGDKLAALPRTTRIEEA